MLKYVIVFLSFFIESSLSVYFYKNSLFLNLFTLLSLYVVYPLFRNDKKKYFIFVFIIGFLYDLVLSSVFGINLILFLFLSLLASWICDNFSETYFNSLFVSLLLIVIYRLVTYLLFIKIHVLKFNFFTFLSSIYSSIIMSIIYITIMYFILKKMKSKYK